MGKKSAVFPSKCFSLALAALLAAALACPAALRAAAAGTRKDSMAGLLATADIDYNGRANLANVQHGLQVLEQAVVHDPAEYGAWWRIARSENYLGRKAQSDKAAASDYKAGIDAGRKAVELGPNQVEGHFWLGANYGLLAESEGWIKGLRLIDTVRGEMETVMRLNPDYEEAAGQRTLARLYYRAPFFKGGDKERSIALLQDCLRRHPRDSFAMLYLADDYEAVGRLSDARSMLERILGLGSDPVYGPELADNQAEARERLQREFHAGK